MPSFSVLILLSFLIKARIFGIQIILGDILGDTLGDILRDTVIQVRHDDRKLVSVRTECRALILSVVDLRLVAVQNFPKAAALALHVAKAVEDIGQHRLRRVDGTVSGSRSWIIDPSGIPPGE